jgi:hypothetical protein
MEDGFQKFQEEMDSINNKQMMGPGMYRLSMAQKDNQPAYPWAPTMVSQRGGVSTVEGVSLVDIDSELMNITRINSKDPKMQYQPDENKKVILKHVQDGGFHQESELLNNPPSLLRGQTKNRWEPLCIDQQASAIEPFRRLGDDTYLSQIDTYQPC